MPDTESSDPFLNKVLGFTLKPWLAIYLTRSCANLSGKVIFGADTEAQCLDWIKANREMILVKLLCPDEDVRFYVIENLGEEGKKLVNIQNQ